MKKLMTFLSIMLIGMMSFAQTIEITVKKNNQKHEVSVFDFTSWVKGAKGTLFVRVPGINNGKTFEVKEPYEATTQARIDMMKVNPEGAFIISNKFKYSSSNLATGNEFIVDLWGTPGTHTITLPQGIEFVSSAVENYQISYGATALNIFYVERTHQDNVITLKITPATYWSREGDWKLWRGPDWYWGTHSVLPEQQTGKRYIGYLTLKFTATGTFTIPEMVGGVFFVESLKTPVEPIPTVVPIAATIISWQTPRPTWATNLADLMIQMNHPVNQSITGLDVNGKYVHKESIVNGASTTNYSFKVIWRADDVDPSKINQAQYIMGDVQDFNPSGLVLKPVWEVWILSEAPTVFPFPNGVFPAKEPTVMEAPVSNMININTASLEELQGITGVGKVLAKRIFDARPFTDVKDLERVSGIGAKSAQDIGKQVSF